MRGDGLWRAEWSVGDSGAEYCHATRHNQGYGEGGGGEEMGVQWRAKWIWDDSGPSPRNYYMLAVKDVEVADTGGEWRVHVSGDSRYRLLVNGEWMGDGPGRCFAFDRERQADMLEVVRGR